MTRRRDGRRIIILAQFYAPEPCAAAHRIRSMAQAFAEQGSEVTVLTAMPSFPDGKIAAPYRGKFFASERDGAVAVHRVWTFASPSLRAYHRLLNWISVACGMLLYLLFARAQVDLVIVSSPPITLAVPALFAATRYRSELITDIRDVFPEVGVQMGHWSNGGIAARMVGRLADRLYARSLTVVAVTPTAREEILSRGVPPTKVTVAANGAEEIAIARQPVLARRGEEFVVAYVGNMGVTIGLDSLLDAAKILLSDKRFSFVLAGSGAQEAHLRQRAQRESLSNVSFLGVMPRERAARVLADADVCVVPLARGIVNTLPTKLFDALHVGCPVIAAADGEARRFVEESGGGVAVAPEDGAALAAAIEQLARTPTQLVQYAQRGGKFLKSHYDRAAIMRELARSIVSPNALRQSNAS